MISFLLSQFGGYLIAGLGALAVAAKLYFGIKRKGADEAKAAQAKVDNDARNKADAARSTVRLDNDAGKLHDSDGFKRD